MDSFMEGRWNYWGGRLYIGSKTNNRNTFCIHSTSNKFRGRDEDKI